MKERRNDLRTQKTYDALIHAFEELLQEKTFEQITVRELCDRARTRTATFYNHFSDKYDFFVFMIRQMRHEFADKAEFRSSVESPEAYYLEYIKMGFQFMEENQRMVSALASDNLLITMLNTASDEMVEALNNHIEKDRTNGIRFPADDNIMTQIFIGTMSQCGKYWFENRKTIKKEYVLGQLTDIIRKLYVTE